MKPFKNFLFLAAMLLVCTIGYGQKPNASADMKGSDYRVDTRIDNIGYWMKKAEQGLVPYNPIVAIPPPVYKGSQIAVEGILLIDSPDIPVTTLTDVTESENSVFIDPNNADYILNSNNSTDWTGSTVTTLYGANYFQSSNAGIGWVGSPSGAGGVNQGDPTTAIGLNGREYVNFISAPGGQGIAWSDDGVSWNTATLAGNPGELADKNHMWIDNKLSSPYEGNLYVAWTDIGGADNKHIKISRSVNDGANWSTPVRLSTAIYAGSHNQGVNLQTGPNGQVYACWAVYDTWPSDETAIGFAKSTDGGVTYGPATRIISNIKGIRTTTVSKNHRVNSFPVMAVDISGGHNNGYIYIVWTNIGTPGTNTGTNASVYMIRSTDGGITWSPPIRVNQGPNTADKKSYFPWITCDPETGELSVIFYDDRNVSATQCETWVAYSVNAGGTWTDFRVSDYAFTPSPINGMASYYMGDYLGITAKGGKVYPCWTQPYNGQFMTFVSPIQLPMNAAFLANPTTICTGSAATFTDITSGSPVTWTWSFPGGTPSGFVGQGPVTVTYNAPGTYDVTLTVTDGTDSDTETWTGCITVKNVIADFSATPTTVIADSNVTFTNNSACSPTAWEWSFPGGTPSSHSGQTPPPVKYGTLGTYDVSLTVTKPGNTDTRTRSAYITVATPVFNMTNGTITTCKGYFYDSGGSSGSYQNNEDYLMTFYPSTPGSMIRFNFTSFATESGYDTLLIYNGINSSASLIGKYEGSAGPGLVTANNGSGALSFRWRSDVSSVYSGWVATITCVTEFVAAPASFIATAATSSQIDLAWTRNTAANNVMILWNTAPTFGTPVDGTAYAVGTPVAGGGTVLCKGSLTSYNHIPLNMGTTYYYKAFSFNGSNTYSAGIPASASTLCGSLILPFTENFGASTLPACWTKQITGTGAVDKWTVSNTAKAGGTAFEMKSTFQNVNPATTRLITPALNTAGMNQLNLTFKHMLDAAATGCTLRIQSSANGVTWTNEAWSVASTSSNVGPATVNTTVLNNLNSPTTYVAFTIEGNLYRYDYWYVDNVTITGNIPTIRDLTNLNVTLTQCIDAMQTINVAGNGTYVTVQPSGSATLIAGQNIFMHPGTLVMPGGSLHAYIAPTGPYCPPPAKESIAAVSETQFAPATSFFRIYPNPTTGEFTLALNGLVPFEPVSVIVYDMQGKKIGSAVMTNQIKHSFSLAGYPSGLYLVVVNSGSQTGSLRIVKAE